MVKKLKYFSYVDCIWVLNYRRLFNLTLISWYQFLGDNKELNRCLGFVRAFVANYYCRFCKLKRNRMQVEETEVPEKKRKIDNYDEDVLEKKVSKTGIREWSSFNNLPGFHVVTSAGNDWMHVVLLGKSQILSIMFTSRQSIFNFVIRN